MSRGELAPDVRRPQAVLIAGPLTTFIKTQRMFWSQMCPDMQRVLGPVNKALRSLPLLVPLRQENRHMAGPLGTAADYIVGWASGNDLRGPLSRGTRVSDDAALISQAASSRLARLRPKRTLSRTEQQLLGRICLLLAHVESAFRTGNRSFVPSATGLQALKKAGFVSRSIDEWFALQVPASLLEEWLALAEQTSALVRNAQGAVYNPIFGDYLPLITGSDGDLFVDHTLYEIKCSTEGFDGDAVRQLLGYCVLNVLNNRGLQIQKIGLMNLRRRFVWADSVEAVCVATGVGSLARLTKEMKRFIDRPLRWAPDGSR